MNIHKETEESLEQLNDEDENVRSQAALNLGWIGNKEVINPLIKALNEDSSPRVRANAAMSLGQLGNKTAINDLIQALADDDATVRGMIAYSLGLMKAKEATQALLEILKNDPHIDTRIAAIEALTQINDPYSIESLAEIMIFCENEKLKEKIAEAFDRICEKTRFKYRDELIEKLEKNKAKQDKIKLEEERKKVIDEIQHLETDEKRKETIKTILNDLPEILQYAIHNEKIPFDSLKKRYNCDINTIEIAISQLIEQDRIEGSLNLKNEELVVYRPERELSEEAKTKILLIRKKMGIDW